MAKNEYKQLSAAILARDEKSVTNVIDANPKAVEHWKPIMQFRATPLWRAAGWQGHHRLVELLLQNGANPGYSLFAASFEGDEAMLDLLFNANLNIDNRFEGRTALADLMYFKRPGNAHCLLANGADPNIQDNSGMTALHYAAHQGIREQVIADLINHGAKIDLTNNAGQTPLGQELAKKPV